jgi:hypothetical protein
MTSSEKATTPSNPIYEKNNTLAPSITPTIPLGKKGSQFLTSTSDAPYNIAIKIADTDIINPIPLKIVAPLTPEIRKTVSRRHMKEAK